MIGNEITGAQVYPQFVFKVPAYDCQIPGLKTRDWTSALQSIEGQTRAFPINDPSKQPAKRWYITGFAQMPIVDVNQIHEEEQSCRG